MCAKDTAIFNESVEKDPVWSTDRIYPSYGRLFQVSRATRRVALEHAGRTPEQIGNALSTFDWAFNRFTEAGGIFIDEPLDDRILHKPTNDRVLRRTLRQLKKTSHDAMRSQLRQHVRPIALELAREAGSYASLAETLKYHMQLRNITDAELANQVGLHINTLRGWINREILPTTAQNLQRLVALERALQVAPGTLMLLVNGPRPHDKIQAGLPSFDTLTEALQHFIELRGWTAKGLAQAAGVRFTTLLTWLQKDCRPRRDDTVAHLARVEQVLELPKETLLHYTDGVYRYMTATYSDFGLTKHVWAIVRSHLPDDFDARSRPEQEEIVTWILENIWRIPRDEDDGGGDRSPYRCKFDRGNGTPDVRDGAFLAPVGLQREYDALIEFKTAYPAPIGKKRGVAWRDGTISARTTAFEVFFGELRQVAPDMPGDMMSFLNAADEAQVRKVIEFIVARRGMPTTTIIAVLNAVIALFNPNDGFVAQHREVFSERFPGMPAEDDLTRFCQQTVESLYAEHGAWMDKITVGRSSFKAVDVVLRDDHPLEAYHAIVEHIDSRTPPRSVQELEWARCQRRAMLVHLLEVLPLRRKELASLILLDEDAAPPSFASLTRRNHGVVYFKNGKWRFRQPKTVFKNHGSPATSDIDVALVNWRDLYDRIDRYVEARKVLLGDGPDHGQFIVKDNSQSHSKPEKPIDADELSNLFLDAIRKFGVYNPYTGAGAIRGLGIHRIQSVRHVVATHLAKVVEFDAAAARLFDSVQQIITTYADYTAEEKFEDADAGYSEAFDDPVEPRRRKRKRAN